METYNKETLEEVFLELCMKQDGPAIEDIEDGGK